MVPLLYSLMTMPKGTRCLGSFGTELATQRPGAGAGCSSPRQVGLFNSPVPRRR